MTQVTIDDVDEIINVTAKSYSRNTVINIPTKYADKPLKLVVLKKNEDS